MAEAKGFYREQARKFAQASRKGWEWAAAHPEEALDIVMQYVDREHIATDMNKNHMFVTLFVGVLDLPTGRMHCVNRVSMSRPSSTA